VTDLAGRPGIPRSIAEVRREIRAAFESVPPLRAVEMITGAGDERRVALLDNRPDSPEIVIRGERSERLLERAVAQARKSGEAQVVGPFPGPSGDQIVRILVPLPQPEDPSAAGAVLSGLFSAEEAFASLRDAGSPQFTLRVEAGGVNLFHAGEAAEGVPVSRRALDVAGETDWTVEVAPTEALLEEERTGLAEIALGVSVGLALLLTLSTWFGERAARRARAFEAAVAERTAELEAARAEAQAANEAKDRFLAMLGHELRNPLASINTALEVLRRQELTDPKGESRMRGIVQRQMDHMARLVDDLLDVSRIERGKLPLKLEPIHLTRLVHDVAEAERARIEGEGLRFEVDVDRRALWADADATRLTQVIYNLLSNAAKFTEPGGSIRLSAHRDEAGTAVVTVRDSGAGIDPEDLERVFEPFAQTELGVQRSTGLGLGLPIVKGLVEAHDGTIRAESRGRGHGTTVEIVLPLREAPEAAAEVRAPVEEAAVAGRRVLLIDDHADSREALRDLLQVFGHRVDVAEDGDQGVRAAAAGAAGGLEVVICDIGLPGELDGYAVAERLRSDPGTASLRLVALTGWSDDASVKRALESGFDRHLTKPVDPALLREILAE
jgi:signal transduction histidine kinase/CheY-like chemotaxis protein